MHVKYILLIFIREVELGWKIKKWSDGDLEYWVKKLPTLA